MIKLPRPVAENLRLLSAELDGQLEGLYAYFQDPDPARAQKVILRAGYSYNLWSRVQSAAQQGIAARKPDKRRQLLLTNCALVARNLDLISRMTRRCLIHAEDVDQTALMRPEAYLKPIKSVRRAVADVLPTLESGTSGDAVRIGRTKTRLDTAYDQLFRTYTRDMRKSKHTEDLAHALLAANEIHRMGDALQGLGEAILSVGIGQSVHFDRYFTLQSVISDGPIDGEDLELEPLAETRSGSGISELKGQTDKGQPISAVFKDGELDKVREERKGVRNWEEVYPGLAPKILSYKKNGQSAALLIEYLQGHTFEHVLVNESDALLRETQSALAYTLRDVWKKTRHDDPAEMASMKQLGARMDTVYRVHPEFRTGPSRIGGVTIDSFDTLIARAACREKSLAAPFSVHIHGDFNLDNVIYDPIERRIHFIDLHRSRFMDYVQDVSVFMVSNYRLQVQDAPIRARITQVATDFHKTAAKFARSQKDVTFEYRLALGLARSFASSTRFVLDRSHARRMMLRARFLLETALAVPTGKEHRLRLPIEELFRD